MSSETRTLSLLATSKDELVERSWRVEVVSGPDRGRVVTKSEGTIIVGTKTEADLPLTDPTVSRYHAELLLFPEGIEVRDLESKNGVTFQGRRVEKVFVPAGSRLTFGQTTVTIEADDHPLGADVPTVEQLGGFVTATKRVGETLGMLKLAAATPSTVLIEGETGTGKEVLAHGVHEESERREGPFVVLDCGAIQESLIESQLFGHKKGAFTGAVVDHVGAIESANGGTLFLDELGELPLALQPKLLRVLESRTVTRLGETSTKRIDVRFVAATNRNLEQMVREKRFRADLFFRVAVVRIKIPPLRERRDDVPLLAERYAASFGGKKLTPEALRALSRYDWPGNARELRNVIERASAVCPRPSIGPNDLFPSRPAELGENEDPGFREAKDRVIAEFERRYVHDLLARTNGNISHAAEEAGLSRNALYAVMRRIGMDPDDSR